MDKAQLTGNYKAMTLSEHQSRASKARWAKLHPKERKRLMSVAGVASAAARRKGALRRQNQLKQDAK